MIAEDYVSYEIAKLLKERGFECATLHYYYDKDGDLLFSAYRVGDGRSEFVAPTLQMAMKWLREVHKIEIWVHYDIDKATWWGGCNPMYEEDEENSNMFQSLLGFDYPGKTYEEACEEAIKYCLENLI